MKTFILAILMIMATAQAVQAQKQPYKVVFDITNQDTAMHQKVIKWIDLILQTNANPELEVVFYGQSLNMVTSGKSAVSKDVERLAALKNVKFAVCEHAMMVHKITKDQLISGVTTVPDGIYEIISKEAQGFGYIKASQ